jgi:hypothetical protein
MKYFWYIVEILALLVAVWNLLGLDPMATVYPTWVIVPVLVMIWAAINAKS